MRAAFLQQSLEIPFQQYPVEAAWSGSARGEAFHDEFGAQGALGGRRRQGSGNLLVFPGHPRWVPRRPQSVSRARRWRRWRWRRWTRRTLACSHRLPPTGSAQRRGDVRFCRIAPYRENSQTREVELICSTWAYFQLKHRDSSRTS